MRKYLLIIIFVLTLTLSSCGDETAKYNFALRYDTTFFNADETVLIEYKTSSEGEMLEYNIDRLLTIEQMLYLNPIIDYNMTVEGFDGNLFYNPSTRCSDIITLKVPINIQVGNTKYKYVDSECEYVPVDSNNNAKGFGTGYKLDGTIKKSKNVTISMIYYDDTKDIRFQEIMDLPHTAELLGVYYIEFNNDLDGFKQVPTNYYRDMAIYEQLYIKFQENKLATDEIRGLSNEVNLLDLLELADVMPLIDNFDIIYEDEIEAVIELEDIIGIGITSVDEEPVEDSEEEPNQEETE